MTALGNKITHHRERLGLSIQDLAVCAGLATYHARALEEGTSMVGDDPCVSIIAALARALGISPLLLAAAAFDDLEVGEL